MGGKSVSRVRAFRKGILPVRKGVDVLSTPATRPVVPASPPHRGPGRAARHPGAQSLRYRLAVAEGIVVNTRDLIAIAQTSEGLSRINVCHRGCRGSQPTSPLQTSSQHTFKLLNKVNDSFGTCGVLDVSLLHILDNAFVISPFELSERHIRIFARSVY